ncbi:unnamed protein product [Parnassius mnemosyne]|uniref:Partner of bursicon n=1 Tax=Parnassius mnemosyne TaxID=213953 RepID=A0AAV1KR37_9NEOP
MVLLTHNKWFICIVHVLLYVILSVKADENCESFPIEIHVTKEEYDEMGSLVRSCSGEVTVNKCEGICSSQIQPSVVTATGFLKECFCCKENYLRERTVTLTHCYYPDGLRIEEEDRATMEVHLREPDECKCRKCGDFSR